MATEVLVNDGGAPARIIPIIANEAITAGDAVGVIDVADGDAKCVQLEQAEATSAMMVGVALTDATAAGDVVNVVSGRGVVVRINCDDVAGAQLLMPHASTGGLLIAYVAAGTGSNKGFDGTPCAITMEDNAAAGLTKCMIL